MKEQLGLNQPLIIQFFLFAFRMLSGDWGLSLSLARGLPVQSLISVTLPRTLDLIILPLTIGLFLGLILGKFSVKTRSKIGSRSIQVLSLIGFAFPIFLLAMLFQFFLGYVFPIFPVTGYKSVAYPDPPLVTGFRVIDSLLSGQWYLLTDYLYHLVLPWITLTIIITVFTIILVRSFLINQLNHLEDGETRSIVPFTFQVGFGFTIIFAFLMVTETMFGFYGIGQLLLIALYNADYYVINGVLFLISISFVLLITIFLLLFIVFGKVKSLSFSKRLSISQMDNEVKLT
jgi:peptide/nickel transport system permease protein